jgi:hypothetical protein
MPDDFLTGNWHDAITVTYTLTPADIFGASNAVTHRRFSSRVVYGIFAAGFLIFVAFVLLNAITGNDDDLALVCLPICFVFTFIALFVGLIQLAIWLRSRAILRQMPAIQGPQMFTLGDAGVKVTNELTCTEMKWLAFVKVLETKGSFLFFASAGNAHVLPKRAFLDREELTEVRQILRSNLADKAHLRTDKIEL